MKKRIDNVIKSWNKLDYEDKKEYVEGIVGWACLFWLVFMLSVIGG